MLHNNNDYLLLLSRQFSGEITPEETETLRAWRAASDENERYALEMESVWERSGAYDRAVPTDVEADFRALQAKIRREEIAVVRSAPLRPFYSLIGRAAAAAAAVVLLAVFALRQWRGAPDAASAVAVAEVEKMEVGLPDGSKAWLRRGARLEYPTRFDGSERRVSLQGEAYFDVAPNPQQPFLVTTADGGKVEVLGTQFGIQPLDDGASVIVREGKVRYTPSGDGEAVVLAGQKATYNRVSRQVKVATAYSFHEIAWQSGILEFVKAPMQMALEDLGQYYKVDLELQNPAMRNCPVSARLDSPDIDKVLDYMTLTYRFNIRKTMPGHYILTGGNCNQ
jgi:transmembrane sensor